MFRGAGGWYRRNGRSGARDRAHRMPESRTLGLVSLAPSASVASLVPGDELSDTKNSPVSGKRFPRVRRLYQRSMKDAEATRSAAAIAPRALAALLEDAFARHGDQLFGLLYYVVGNREDAHDALQETFLKCWRHRHQVPEVENLRAWIFRIALNTGRDTRTTAWRRRRRPIEAAEMQLAANTLERPGSTPEAEAIREEELSLVRRALRDLRVEEQEVFLLRQNGDLTYDQIAVTLSLPVGTVKTRMRLALGKLREALNSEA